MNKVLKFCEYQQSFVESLRLEPISLEILFGR